MAQRYVVIDLETTGNSPKKGDRIIQFAAVVIENDTIVDEYSTYLQPEQSISIFIEELTGINNDTVKDAPLFEEVAERICALLEGACFVAHNVLFDLSFLKEELERCGYEPFYGSTIDTVELAKILKPTADGYKLNQLAKEENLEHPRPHQADSDAYVTALLLLQLKKKLYSLPVMTLKKLSKLSFSLKSEIAELIDECLTVKLSKAELHNPAIETFRGLAFKKVQPAKACSEKIPEFPFSEKEKVDRMKRAFPEFEARKGQLAMMDTVYHSFIQEQHSIIEAGTGIGKSLGYLLPAAYFAKQQDTPVVISTYTLQLQEQLLSTEVPKLKEILPFSIHVVLLKGRANYLSLAKFERALRGKEDNYETALTKMQILVWLTETETGEKDELHLTSGGELFWNRIKSDGFTSPDLQIPWKSKDFYEKAKLVASKADIIVTNHAFLMADIMSSNRIIPEGYLVLDEAHHIEQAASKYLGKRLNYISVKTMLNRLGTSDQKQLLRKLEKILSNKGITPERTSSFIDGKLTDFMYEFEQLFQLLSSEANKSGKSSGPHRIPLKIKDVKEWQGISFLVERLIDNLSDIKKTLFDRICMLKNEELTKNELFYMNDVELLISGMNEIIQSLAEFFIHPSDQSIYWIEFTKSVPQHGITLSSQPVSGNKILWDSCFVHQKSVIMTSATLSVKDTFSFFIEQLGMQNIPVHTYNFPSPFKYEENVRVLVASDIPEVNTISSDDYAIAVARHIIAAAQAANGRMMVLFTSHDMLRTTYQKVKATGFLQEFTLFAQGLTGGSKMRLLRNFQNFDKAVLFGTTSLWEGVDIPGEDLSCLVIVRLPFSPPDDPIIQAKCNLYSREGRNPFYAYSLPEAILRFRQGFGRLIRTSTDRGVLLVLDRRIMTSSYGSEFRQAIPPVEWLEVNEDDMTYRIEEWI